MEPNKRFRLILAPKNITLSLIGCALPLPPWPRWLPPLPPCGHPRPLLTFPVGTTAQGCNGKECDMRGWGKSLLICQGSAQL